MAMITPLFRQYGRRNHTNIIVSPSITTTSTAAAASTAATITATITAATTYLPFIRNHFSSLTGPSNNNIINNNSTNNNSINTIHPPHPHHRHSRSYYTNTEVMKRDDPYAQLGLTWGATTTEIKEAYKEKAKTLHPDVNHHDPPHVAQQKFQSVQRAYQILMGKNGTTATNNDDDDAEQWSFAVWRHADRVAQERTDVAGMKKKRPVKPAVSLTNQKWGLAGALLGHPDGRGVTSNRRRGRNGEYLGSGDDGGSSSQAGKVSSTVGTGRNKWVTPKEFRPWNPSKNDIKRAGKAHLNLGQFKKWKDDDDDDDDDSNNGGDDSNNDQRTKNEQSI